MDGLLNDRSFMEAIYKATTHNRWVGTSIDVTREVFNKDCDARVIKGHCSVGSFVGIVLGPNGH